MSSKREAMRAKIEGNVGEVGEVASNPAPAAAAPRPAGRHDGVRRSKDVADVPVGKITADPDQPRKEFDPDALAQLASSLKSKGQLQPIRVRWSDPLSMYVVIVGERRWRAATMAGLPTLSCVIHEGDLPEKDLRAIQLIENCVREDLNPVERAVAMQSLIEAHGWTQEQLAGELGIGRGAVAKSLPLLDLPPEVREKVESGAISGAVGYQLSKVEDPADQLAIAEKAESGGLSRDGVAAEVAQVVAEKRGAKGKGRGGARGKAQKQTNRIFNTGVRIKFTAESKKGFDVLSLLEASREVTRKLEEEAATLAESVA